MTISVPISRDALRLSPFQALIMFPVAIKGALQVSTGEVLLALNDRNEWELPGGRIEIGENPEVCLAREFLVERAYESLRTAPTENDSGGSDISI